MPDDRISTLGKRFQRHGVGRPPTSEKNRERQSIYIDKDLMERVGLAHLKVNHELYPKQISKSAFLEAVMGYGLEHLDELKSQLSEES